MRVPPKRDTEWYRRSCRGFWCKFADCSIVFIDFHKSRNRNQSCRDRNLDGGSRNREYWWALGSSYIFQSYLRCLKRTFRVSNSKHRQRNVNRKKTRKKTKNRIRISQSWSLSDGRISRLWIAFFVVLVDLRKLATLTESWTPQHIFSTLPKATVKVWWQRKTRSELS